MSADQAGDFLRHVTPAATGLHRVISDSGDWCGEWFVDTAEAARYAASRAKRHNVYLSAALLDPAGRKPGSRGTADDAGLVTALWADIDIAGPGHKKPNLPQDRVSARTLIDNFEISPTIRVDSGNGYQLWWVLEEPVGAEDGALLELAVERHVHQIGAAFGYTDLDSVHDLARLMRLPGTINWKDPANPKPVTFDYVGGLIRAQQVRDLPTWGDAPSGIVVSARERLTVTGERGEQLGPPSVRVGDIPDKAIRDQFRRRPADRSAGCYYLVRSMVAANYPSALLEAVIETYPPARTKAEESTSPKRRMAALVNLWLKKAKTFHSHPGQNCYQAKCGNCPDWLLSRELRPKVDQAHRIIKRDPGISRTELFRRLYGGKFPPENHRDKIVADGVRVYGWQIEKVRRGSRGTVSEIFRPKGTHRLRCCGGTVSVDPATGEILS